MTRLLALAYLIAFCACPGGNSGPGSFGGWNVNLPRRHPRRRLVRRSNGPRCDASGWAVCGDPGPRSASVGWPRREVLGSAAHLRSLLTDADLDLVHLVVEPRRVEAERVLVME